VSLDFSLTTTIIAKIEKNTKGENFEYTNSRVKRSDSMIFLYLGSILLVIGGAFFIFPAKSDNLVYGYRTPLSKESEENWNYAQKISSRFLLLFGAVMTIIGFLLKTTGNTNFFIIEMLAVPWFIAPMFGLIETKLKQFDKERRGENDEYFND